MVIKWFPAAVAAVFIGPSLAAAQEPGVPTVEVPAAQTAQTTQTTPAPTPVAVATPAAPVAAVQPTRAPAPAAPAPPAAGVVSLLGMAIVPDRSDRPVIQSVEPGSPAARAGLREDDLIEGLGRQATPTMRELLSFAIPLIRDLDPGTKLTWHVNRDGRDVALSLPRPTDRELGPLSDVEQRVINLQAGTSLGYYPSSDVPAPSRPLRRERRHVGHDVYADAQYSWFYDGDDPPLLVRQWLTETMRGKLAQSHDYRYYWWYDGDEEMPEALVQWIQRAGALQANRLNPDLQYYWWYDGD